MASSVFTVMGRSRSRSPRSDSCSARRLRSRSPDKEPDKEPGAESEQPGTGKEPPTQHPSDGAPSQAGHVAHAADGVTLAGIEFRAIIASAINDLLDAHALGLSSEPSSEQ